MSFKREDKYLVIKRKDIKRYLSSNDEVALQRIADHISEMRKNDGRPLLECVVIENDWPEYEQTWQAIEKRMTYGVP